MSDIYLKTLYDQLEYYKGEMMMEETIGKIVEREASLRNQRQLLFWATIIAMRKAVIKSKRKEDKLKC